MSVLSPTPREHLVDAEGRPYFLWDSNMDLDQFEEVLRSGEPAARVYLIGKLMRQAKPDDVLSFVSIAEIRRLFPEARRYLGHALPFWQWVLEVWGEDRAA